MVRAATDMSDGWQPSTMYLHIKELLSLVLVGISSSWRHLESCPEQLAITCLAGYGMMDGSDGNNYGMMKTRGAICPVVPFQSLCLSERCAPEAMPHTSARKRMPAVKPIVHVPDHSLLMSQRSDRLKCNLHRGAVQRRSGRRCSSGVHMPQTARSRQPWGRNSTRLLLKDAEP